VIDAHLKAGRHDSVITICRRALEQDSTRIVLYNLMASAHAAKGEHPDAIATLQRALQLSPEFAVGWTNLGNLLSSLGRHAEALPSLARAAELDPGDVSLLRRLARSHLEMEQHDEALGVARQALEALPGSAVLIGYVGLAEEGRGNDEEALSAYLQAGALDPGYVEVQFRASEVARRLGRTAVADSCRAQHLHLRQLGHEDEESRTLARRLRAGVESAPDEAIAHARLGGFYLFHDYLPESLALFERATELDGSARLRNEIAGLLGKKGHAEEALAYYRRCLDVDPEFTAALVNAGNLLSSLGRASEALPLLERAVTLLPDNAKVHFFLGLTHRGLGDVGKARASLERALELSGDADEGFREQVQTTLSTME
jgi:tetratricopeptide (TPR) repeat protein